MDNIKGNGQYDFDDCKEIIMTESNTLFSLYKKWIKNASVDELKDELRKIKLWKKEPADLGTSGKELLNMAENSIKNELTERGCKN